MQLHGFQSKFTLCIRVTLFCIVQSLSVHVAVNACIIHTLYTPAQYVNTGGPFLKRV